MKEIQNYNKNIFEHFAEVGMLSKRNNYACHLILMNGDPQKEVIALGQTYFAIQTIS